MFQVAFISSPLSKDRPVPRVVQRETISFEEVLTHMARSAVTSRADMVAVTTQFSQALQYFLARGCRVHTPLGAFSVHLRQRGVATAERALSINSLTIHLRPKKEVISELKRTVRISVVDTTPTKIPLIYNVSNVDDKERLNKGQPGDILHLTGSRLTFDKTDPRQGVFFISKDRQKTRALVYSRIGSNFIDCKIPALAAGDYTLAVCSLPAKVPKFGVFKSLITVGVEP